MKILFEIVITVELLLLLSILILQIELISKKGFLYKIFNIFKKKPVSSKIRIFKELECEKCKGSILTEGDIIKLGWIPFDILGVYTNKQFTLVSYKGWDGYESIRDGRIKHTANFFIISDNKKTYYNGCIHTRLELFDITNNLYKT